MNQRFLDILGEKSALYPHVLEAKFPRVFLKLTELWETQMIEEYLRDLILNSRDVDRDGFPPDAAIEILRLSSYYNELHELDRHIDVWGEDNEKFRKELAQSGYEFTSNGFLKSVDDGNLLVAKRLLSAGVNHEVRDEKNWTAFMIACSKGFDEFAQLLITLGAKTDVHDSQGYTPLHWAATNGHTSTVKMLLEQGANANMQSLFGWTALMQAASRGHLLSCAYLIAHGADVNIAGNDGSTALHKAAQGGHDEVVTLLLNKGASRIARNNGGKTPLDFAEKSGRFHVVNLLKQDS